MNKAELGLKLRDLRIASGLKWDAILQAMHDDHGVDIARSTIYGYEHGRTYPDPNTLFALCNVYGSDNYFRDLGLESAPTLESDGIEELILFENEFTPEEWIQIKGFVNYIISNHEH